MKTTFNYTKHESYLHFQQLNIKCASFRRTLSFGMMIVSTTAVVLSWFTSATATALSLLEFY